MVQTLATFNTLSTAEEYLDFFGIPYDAKMVSVNRLHILRKFSEFVQEINRDTTLNEGDRLGQYQAALQNAYTLFLSSSSLEQKLFKVFKQKPGNVVLVSDIATE
ncbi:MAG: nitrogenase-stabilizing/protective protein NifW [Leptolyngbyaceae bacterium]|nr:nitrogenase-stabilizing/protective protein NifW [Leptolyngbyaceae bacterium]